MNNRGKQQTIYDISKQAGVSIATVSRVLNNSPKVSAATREKILRIIEESGYEPNVFARGLGIGTMKTIGICCADVSDTYLANAVSFLERELKQNGFNSILSCTSYDYDTKVACVKEMENRCVDAVIMVGSQYIESTPKKNKYLLDTAQKRPVMMLNGYLPGKNIYCNLSDDKGAFYNAACELLAQGAKNILFLYRDKTYSCLQKQEGYAEALRNAGIEADGNSALRADGNIYAIQKKLERYYSEKYKFDSVLACDDELAMGAVKFAKSKGLKVPEEFSIIGCNNSVLSICSDPELSSVDNKCEILCVNTVNSLMRVLDNLDVPKKTVVSTEYVERGTTRKKKEK